MLDFENILQSEIDATEARLFEHAEMLFSRSFEKGDATPIHDKIYGLVINHLSEKSTPESALHKTTVFQVSSGLDAIEKARSVLGRRDVITGGVCKEAYSAALRLLMMASESVGCIESLTGDRFAHIKDRLADISKKKSAINAVSGRDDQILKPDWLKHCERALNEGRKIEQLNDLLGLQGYDARLTKISAITLKKWARESGVKFKSGRKKHV